MNEKGVQVVCGSETDTERGERLQSQFLDFPNGFKMGILCWERDPSSPLLSSSALFAAFFASILTVITLTVHRTSLSSKQASWNGRMSVHSLELMPQSPTT